MPRLHYRDPDTGEWVPIGTQGPPGPSAVSADAGNVATLGTDSLIYVPPGGVSDHGALTGLGDDDHPQYVTHTEGNATYAPASHGTHADLASTTPAGLTPDIAGATGVGTTAARADHAHNVPAAAPTANLTASTTNAEGSGASFARHDHSHAITTAAPVALGSANSAGTAAGLARADHVHIYPSAANVGADPAGTAASAVSTHAGAADPHTAYQLESEKGAANGYASLDATGTIPTAQLPPLAINDTFNAASESAMLALTAQRGDMCIRSDNGRTYVLSAEPASVLANWKEVMAAGQVQSVNGQTGVVLLTATNITSTATGSVAATTVQAAIAELASEKADAASVPALASTTPAALTPDIAGAQGSGTTSARADHVHNVPAAAPTTTLTTATTNAEGTGSSFARNDHTHAISTTTNAPNAVSGAAGASGTSANVAKHDHTHRVDVGSPVALGSALGDGVSNQIARADHVHPYPSAANVGAEAAGAVAAHAGAADPHTGYQQESEKGVAGGYASLDGAGKVPTSQLPAMGVADEVLVQVDAPTPAVGLDLWLDPDADPAAAGTDHGNLSGLADDDHPQYLNLSRGDARYVNVDGDTMTGRLTLRGATPDQLFWNDAGSQAAILGIEGNTALSIWDGAKSGYGYLRANYVELYAAPTAAIHAATKGYVDGLRAPRVSVAAPGSPVAGDIWIRGQMNRIRPGWQTNSGNWRLNFGFGYGAVTFAAVAAGAQLTGPAASLGLARATYDGTFTAGDLIYFEFDVQDITGRVRATKAYEASGAWSSGSGAQTVSLLVTHSTQEYGLELEANAVATVTGIRVYNLTTEQAAVYMYTSSGWVQVNSSAPAVPGRNRIINGDFSVNQRAFTSTTVSGTYGLDRWRYYYTGGTCTYSHQAIPSGTLLIDLPEAPVGFVRLDTTGQSAAADRALLYHQIESVRTLSNKTVTLSFWARVQGGPSTGVVAAELYQNFGTGGSPSAPVSTHAGKVTVGTTWARYSLTVRLPSIMNKVLGTARDDFLGVGLWTSGGTNYATQTGSMGIQNALIDFWGVQLEEGLVATPFEQKNYVEELRDCQRYYYRIVKSGSSTRVAIGWATSATQAYMVSQLPVPMRITPTIGFASAAGFSLSDSVTLTAVASISASAVVQMASPNTTEFFTSVTVASGLTAFRPAALEMTPSATYIDFSAEY